MARKNVLVEIRRRPELEGALFAPGLATLDVSAAAGAAPLPGLSLDPSFPPVGLPASAGAGVEAAATPRTGPEIPDPEPGSVLVRGTIDEGALAPDMFAAGPVGDVTGVFADPVVEPCLTCAGSDPLGTAADVARLLDVPRLARAGMDGRGVLLAIVDTGINLAHLRSRGLEPGFSAGRSWAPAPPPGQPSFVPGQMPVGHGTMCAFDALIAAPRATLLDVAALTSRRTGASAMDGLLSDAVLGYSFLLGLLRGLRRPGDFRSLVVSNSWGMFQRSWDLPPGHPGNYSANPAHPFNRVVATLERAGADILFAAGNCGRECPDGRCGADADGGIYGANSHPAVLSVAGVDVGKSRVGYSTRGPGHLDPRKPDVCGYTHFAGSGVYPADGGTSAATPVVAGLVAAFRSRFPSGPDRMPAALRDLVRRTAEKPGADGFDEDHGFGVASGSRLAQSTLPPSAPEGDSDDTGPHGGPRQGDTPDDWDGREDIMSGGDDQEFMQALQAFGFQGGGGGGGGAGFGAGQAFSQQPTSAGGQETMSGSDQEFMQALQAFGFQGGGGGGGGAEFGAGSFQGEFGGGFGAAQEGGGQDQEFFQALAAFGGPTAGFAAAGATAGAGGGGAAEVTAVPNLGQICSVWRSVRPIVLRILPFIAALPGIGTATATAFRALGTLLDAVCASRATAAQLCQRWRGGLRAIVVRVAQVVGRIPIIGGAAQKALNALVGAIDTVCRAV